MPTPLPGDRPPRVVVGTGAMARRSHLPAFRAPVAGQPLEAVAAGTGRAPAGPAAPHPAARPAPETAR
ncbi:hypothetical protein [uncultured Streptomyces sp.]|uniref:hypothetical protein n=1 Tax=uncultured Streptomyces sp. TaxID=174707 RepID=UPI00262942E9|nr:hypothetical protein [uncultured Streptomyces sp.]